MSRVNNNSSKQQLHVHLPTTSHFFNPTTNFPNYIFISTHRFFTRTTVSIYVFRRLQCLYTTTYHIFSPSCAMPRQFTRDVTAVVKDWRKLFHKAGTLSKHTRCLRCGRHRGELHRGQWRTCIHKCICCGRRKHLGQPCPVMLGSTFFFTRGWWKRHTGSSRPGEKCTTASVSRLGSKAKRRKLQETDGGKPSETPNSKENSGRGVDEEGDGVEGRRPGYGEGSRRTHRRNVRRRMTQKLERLKMTGELPPDADWRQLSRYLEGVPQSDNRPWPSAAERYGRNMWVDREGCAQWYLEPGGSERGGSELS